MLYGILKPLAVALMRLLFRLEAEDGARARHGAGADRLEPLSMLDPPLVGGAAPRQLYFLAKAELFRVPLFGRLIRRLNARPVRRDGSDTRALRTALRAARGGQGAAGVPRGHPRRGGQLARGQARASGMLAVMSGAPVVPAYVSGSGRALPRGAALPRPAKVRVTFGPPLTLQAGAPERGAPRGKERVTTGARRRIVKRPRR